MREVVAEKQSWKFPEGHEIAPGRTTLKALGGGNRYEVYLVWDQRHFSVMVAKILRPDLVEEGYALRGLRREMEALEALAHPGPAARVRRVHRGAAPARGRWSTWRGPR